MSVPPGAGRPASAFAPFANRTFRLLWGANVLSNIGGWMATTGAAWEMTSLTQEPIFVALLSAASALPMFLFCFFAGVLADRFDRRRYIIVCQIWMMAVAATLAALAFSGLLDHWSLLGLSFCMGLGNAMNAPAWHAVVPRSSPVRSFGLRSRSTVPVSTSPARWVRWPVRFCWVWPVFSCSSPSTP